MTAVDAAIQDSNRYAIALGDLMQHAAVHGVHHRGQVALLMRMLGHAQHDPAEYVPKEMRAFWESRDPITLHEELLFSEKLLDAKGKQEIEAKIEALLEKDRELAENSPLPPPELAAEGVYCEGCHKIEPKWERPVAEVMPPKPPMPPPPLTPEASPRVNTYQQK